MLKRMRPYKNMTYYGDGNVTPVVVSANRGRQLTCGFESLLTSMSCIRARVFCSVYTLAPGSSSFSEALSILPLRLNAKQLRILIKHVAYFMCVCACVCVYRLKNCMLFTCWLQFNTL